MSTTELSELAAVVARIMHETHPDLDTGFVMAVLHAEAEAACDDGAALQAIRHAVDAACGGEAV